MASHHENQRLNAALGLLPVILVRNMMCNKCKQGIFLGESSY